MKGLCTADRWMALDRKRFSSWVVYPGVGLDPQRAE